MDITQTDLSILMVCTIMVILMTITFPPMGLTAEGNVTEPAQLYDDFPELNIQGDRFDFAGSFPTVNFSSDVEQVSDSATQMFNATSNAEYQIIQDEVFGSLDYDHGFAYGNDSIDKQVRMTLSEFISTTQAGTDVAYIDVSDGSETDALGESVLLSVETNDPDQIGWWNVSLTVTDISADEVTVSVSVLQSPSEEPGFLTRAAGFLFGSVPVIGPFLEIGFYGLSADAGSLGAFVGAIAATFAYMVDIIIWFPLALITVITNLLAGLTDAGLYLFAFMGVVIDAMLSVVEGLPAPIALFYVLPVFGMFGVMAKILLIMIGKLPLT